MIRRVISETVKNFIKPFFFTTFKYNFQLIVNNFIFHQFLQYLIATNGNFVTERVLLEQHVLSTQIQDPTITNNNNNGIQ